MVGKQIIMITFNYYDFVGFSKAPPEKFEVGPAENRCKKIIPKGDPLIGEGVESLKGVASAAAPSKSAPECNHDTAK